MVSQKQKVVDTFIHRNRTRGVHSIFGEVRFRRQSAFCGCFGWAVSATHAKPFSHCAASLSNLVLPFSSSSLLSRLYEAFIILNIQPKNKFNQLKTTLCCLHKVCEVTVSSEEGCLNTLRLFSLGGELTLIFFLFLAEEIASKPNHIFVV